MIAPEAHRIKNQREKAGQERPLYTTGFDAVQLPPTGNSLLILADADSIGLAPPGREFERAWKYDESNFADLEADG
jgi:hypothetical protein